MLDKNERNIYMKNFKSFVVEKNDSFDEDMVEAKKARLNKMELIVKGLALKGAAKVSKLDDEIQSSSDPLEAIKLLSSQNRVVASIALLSVASSGNNRSILSKISALYSI